jgi:hypothetical protein
MVLGGVGAADLTLLDKNECTYQLTDPLMVYKTPLYADNVLIRAANNLPLSAFSFGVSNAGNTIKIVTNKPTRLLWHARLGHLNF